MVMSDPELSTHYNYLLRLMQR